MRRWKWLTLRVVHLITPKELCRRQHPWEGVALEEESKNLTPCRICNGTRLQAKWNSEDGLGWVHCDTCGNMSTPRPLAVGRAELMAQWNKEQES